MIRRHEPRPPQPAEKTLLGMLRFGVHDYVVGKSSFMLQAITQPRSKAGAARNLAARLDIRDRRVMIDRLGKSTVNNAQVLDDFRSMREQELTQTPLSLLSCLVNSYLLGATGRVF